MKQIDKNIPDINLDDLELEIAQAAKASKTSADPLAELARIMGQDDPFAGFDKAASQAKAPASVGRSLDDILNAPPSSILRSDQREANFDAALDQPAMRPPAAPADEALDDLNEPKASVESVVEKKAETSLDDDNDDLFEREELERDELERDELAGAADIDALEQKMAEARDKLLAEEADRLAPPTKTAAGAPQFEDMLAEFESAMRDVGGEKIATTSTSSLSPVTVPPPPDELLYAQETKTGYENAGYVGVGLAGAGLAGAAAAGAAIIASGTQASSQSSQNTHADGASQKVKKPRRGLMIAGGVMGVAVIGISALFAFGTGPKKSTNGAAPVIAAKSGVTKERPTNPGGVDVPNQDKEVLKAPSAAPAVAERVAPREEQPVDLKQAQNSTASAPAVRQIPGAGAVILPSAPASPSVAGSQPVPRPVASVPIAIAGTPASDPVAPAPVPVVATPTPVPAAPVPAAPAPAAAAPTQAPVVVAARPADAEAPAAPRRVRAVPIKTDGEAAPRPQTRPAQAARPAPFAPEPDAANAPMRITPQAVRNAQRVASVEPTEPAAPAAPRAAASAGGGSGFTVQLGAEGSQESARAKFNKLRSDHSGVLGSQNANIRNAEVNGRSVYRIRVGNMSREQAVSMCERLKADGGNCFVARN